MTTNTAKTIIATVAWLSIIGLLWLAVVTTIEDRYTFLLAVTIFFLFGVGFMPKSEDASKSDGSN